MDKNAVWKWLILVFLLAVSMAVIYPPTDRFNADGKLVRAGKLRLGLDLQGGTSFIVEVDEDILREQIRESGEEIAADALENRVRAQAKQSRDASLEAIRNRVDGLGIAEPAIYPQGDTRIVIQMPGIDAAKRDAARKSIQSAAFLEFRLVHRNSEKWVNQLFSEGAAPSGFRIPDGGGKWYVLDTSVARREGLDRAFWEAVRRFRPREGAEFMLQRDRTEDGRVIYRPYYIETQLQLTGKAIQSAMMDYDHLNRPKISLEFTRDGRRAFGQVIRDYRPNGEKNRGNPVGRQLAIILDGTLYSAPVIAFEREEPVRRAEITGSFTRAEAQQLVNVLRSGALPAAMRIVEERTVDPTLGRDSIRSGIRAAVIGGIAVLVFMLAYYQFAGMVANLALLLNLLLLPLGALVVSGFMGVFTRSLVGSQVTLPTLTLPGVAGIILMLGMAVDANVLIYERIREELKAGKHFLPALDAGYEKAFTTILDANLTTLIAAIIMFWQGSGPVRGYAVTLSAGILVSMYTAVWVTKMLFHVLADRFHLGQLRMREWVKTPHVDFLRWRRSAFALSGALLLVSLAVFYFRGERNFGVDFRGGSSIVIAYDFKGETDRISVGDIRSALTEAGIRDAQIQYQDMGETENRAARQVLVINTDFASADRVVETLTARLAERSPRIVQRENVGPQIGRELKRKGMVALIWAMIAMVIYIAWRFEFGYSVGAIVALLHDALISVGLFCLLGRQLSMPSIAVVLTIIGYSVNDTIVIFDRIRESRRLYRDRPLTDLANLSINATLSRTLLTSLTTLLSVLALLLFGGGAIRDFALLLMFGIIVGTYSTIFIATPIALAWHRESPAKVAMPPREGRNEKRRS